MAKPPTTRRTPTGSTPESRKAGLAEAEVTEMTGPDPATAQPAPPSWEPAGTNAYHRHNGDPAKTHPGGDQDHRHGPGGTIVWEAADTTETPNVPAVSGDDPPAPSAGGWFAASASGGQPADPPPAPSAVDAATTAPRGSDERAGAGRPIADAGANSRALEVHSGNGRSIGRVVANTAMDTAMGVPPELADESAHAREAAEILVEAAADHFRHHRLMPESKLLDLEAVVDHMVRSRGLRS